MRSHYGMTEYPWFKFHSQDFLGDIRVAAMSPAALGAYVRLLCMAWQDGGYLPSADRALARLASMTLDEWQGVASEVLTCFTEEGDRIYQKRLRAEYQAVVNETERRAEAGRKGAKARWGGHCGSHSDRTVLANGNTRLVSSSTPDSSSSEGGDARGGEIHPAERYTTAGEFSRLWQAIPPNRRRSRQRSATAFVQALRRSATTTTAIIDAAVAYYASAEGRSKFAKSLAGWLEEGRYDDDPSAWERGHDDETETDEDRRAAAQRELEEARRR